MLNNNINKESFKNEKRLPMSKNVIIRINNYCRVQNFLCKTLVLRKDIIDYEKEQEQSLTNKKKKKLLAVYRLSAVL